MLPVIFGIEGARLSADERALFRSANPAGYILFGRNICSPEQVRALTDEVKTLSGRDALPILVDQEGGRVARFAPPLWPAFPPAPTLDALYDRAPASAMAAARANAHAIGLMLHGMGLTVNCMPMLEVAAADADPIIAERALGREPQRVAALGRAILNGLADGGIAGVIKHLPGYGRARVDAHHKLPTIDGDEESLLAEAAPFRALADCALFGMTAHATYPVWDARLCATLSPHVINHIIRDTIGFGGVLMSDGIEMEALDGAIAQRSARAIAAGCDLVLHCTGNMAEMDAIASALSPMAGAALERYAAAMHGLQALRPHGDIADAIARRDALFAAMAA